ncbi:MAG: helix-hairpin-helix domain-containing protein [Verrucomicrobiia bacterium]
MQEACDFLDGRSRELLKKLEDDMHRAAERMDFERAADIRNLLSDLKKTTRPARRFKRHIPTTIIPEEDIERLREVLCLPRRLRHIECFDISNISTTHKVASMVAFHQGVPDKANYRRYRIKTVEGQDDFASIAEVVHRRYARLIREGRSLPDLIVVDGGKGQLSAALKSLNALGQFAQPIIGLAKQREEIFLPLTRDPLILPPDSGALRLLQRLRDEAHRFANAYHQLLLKRRISESLLDEIPGISARRKAALLQTLGSIERIRSASAEELTSVEGISPKLAETILRFFQRHASRRTLPDPEPDSPPTYRLRTHP